MEEQKWIRLSRVVLAYSLVPLQPPSLDAGRVRDD